MRKNNKGTRSPNNTQISPKNPSVDDDVWIHDGYMQQQEELKARNQEMANDRGRFNSNRNHNSLRGRKAPKSNNISRYPEKVIITPPKQLSPKKDKKPDMGFYTPPRKQAVVYNEMAEKEKVEQKIKEKELEKDTKKVTQLSPIQNPAPISDSPVHLNSQEKQENTEQFKPKKLFIKQVHTETPEVEITTQTIDNQSVPQPTEITQPKKIIIIKTKVPEQS